MINNTNNSNSNNDNNNNDNNNNIDNNILLLVLIDRYFMLKHPSFEVKNLRYLLS